MLKKPTVERSIVTGSLRSEFKVLLWNIKRALLDKKAFTVIHWSHLFSLQLIKQLHNIGVIESYERKGNYLFIRLPPTNTPTGRLSYLSHHVNLDTISALPSPRHGGINYSAKSIQKYQRLSGQHKTAFFNTDKGLIDSSQAALKQVGGQPLFQIK